jgi:glyoxylase-like metal-dependent hydrolase (beta-lactamase superfamily II)
MATMNNRTLAGEGLALSTGPLSGQDAGIVPAMVRAAADMEITVEPLRRNIRMLQGSGGNILVLTGPDGKVLVDSGFAVSRPRIERMLSSINAEPVRFLIDTHWHTDHTDGNAWVHAAGASIIAHENTRRHLSQDTRVEDWQFTFPAAPADAIPETVFARDYHLSLDETTILLRHYEPAHTDSDISVTFGEADVVHVGDTWWNGVYPFIDYSTGGSIDGAIRAAETNLAATLDSTIVVPGHGRPGGKAELREFRDMLASIREKVAALKKQGRSIDETIAARPTAAYDALWGNFLITPAFFTRLVYAGV